LERDLLESKGIARFGSAFAFAHDDIIVVVFIFGFQAGRR